MNRTPLDQATDTIRHRCSSLRAVLRIAETKAFGIAFEQASEDHRKLLILISTPRAMREWIAKANGRPLETLSYRRLREMGKNANLFNYSRLTRDELIAALEKKDHARIVETSPKSDR